jgi:arsenate reductase-like glutaredoxin family protein
MEVTLEERDFFKEPFSAEEVHNLLQGRPLEDIFSWKSPSFKALGLKPERLTDDDLAQLMLKEPRLMRRPLIQINGQLIVGLDKKALEEAAAGG